MNNWHNTTDEANIEELNLHAETQEEKILEFFKMYPDNSYTPFEVHRHVLRDCPVTSVRRALSNLTTEGKLVKTSVKVKEKYGKSNYKWKLVVNSFQQTLF
jgi:hypothetical protein